MAGSSKDPHLNQLITEFYTRSIQVILESRLPACMPASSHHEDGSTFTSAHRAKRHTFNIVLGKFGQVMDRMEPWCRGVQEPMVIDIFYLKRGQNRVFEGKSRGMEQGGQKMVQGAGNLAKQGSTGIALAASGLEHPILLERWTMEFSQHNSRSSGLKERETDLQTQKGAVSQHLRGTQNYKSRFVSSSDNQQCGALAKGKSAANRISLDAKMAILLRSMYSTTRLLPAQNLFRLLSTTGNGKFKLSYKVSAWLSPLSDHTKKDMTHFCFTPVECHGGRLCISVTYRRTIPAVEHEMSSITPQIIPDYVGRAASLQLPIGKIEHLHSLPTSAHRLSSFKFYNLQQHQASNKEVAAKEGQCWVPVHPNAVSMGCGDFSLVQDEDLECPFAINDERHDRMERPRLRSAKSDSGGYGTNVTEVLEGGPLASVMALLRPAESLSRAQHDNALFYSEPKKTATDALKELKMYIDFRDALLN
eukprot:c24430_g1_i1 orf=675-2102(+)